MLLQASFGCWGVWKNLMELNAKAFVEVEVFFHRGCNGRGRDSEIGPFLCSASECCLLLLWRCRFLDLLFLRLRFFLFFWARLLLVVGSRLHGVCKCEAERKNEIRKEGGGGHDEF